MGATKLDSAAIEEELAKLTGWELRDGKIHKDYSFADFSERTTDNPHSHLRIWAINK